MAVFTANTLSVTGAAACVAAAGLLTIKAPLHVVALIYGFGCALDTVDGWYARRYPQPQPPWRGGLLDALCDKVGEAALAFAMLFAWRDQPGLACLAAAFLTGLFSSYVKSAAVAYGAPLHWPEVRYFGRASRAVLLTALLLTGGLVASAQHPPVLMLGLPLLVHNSLTSSQRLAKVVRLVLSTRPGLEMSESVVSVPLVPSARSGDAAY